MTRWLAAVLLGLDVFNATIFSARFGALTAAPWFAPVGIAIGVWAIWYLGWAAKQREDAA